MIEVPESVQRYFERETPPNYKQSSLSIQKGDSGPVKFLKRLTPTQLAAILHEGYLNNEGVGKTLKKAAGPASQLATFGAGFYALNELHKEYGRSLERYNNALTAYNESRRNLIGDLTEARNRADRRRMDSRLINDGWLDEGVDLYNDLSVPQMAQDVRESAGFFNLVQEPSRRPMSLRPQSSTVIRGPRVGQ